MRWLVTGYGPFEDVMDNVSSRVARECGQRYEVLEVAYKAVDDFIAGLNKESFDGWIALGHAKNAEKIRIETLGRNVIGPRPDVRGQGRLNLPINAEGPETLAATAWIHPELRQDSDAWKVTDDAGSYLCNYILYRALEVFPDKYIGFLHLPPADVMPVKEQVAAVQQILTLTDAAANP